MSIGKALLKKVHMASRAVCLLLCLVIPLIPSCEDSGKDPGTMDRDVARTLASLHRVGEMPFYAMTYYGDYGFSDFLKTGGRSISQARESSGNNPWGCTCFAAMGNEATRLFGRNFDWHTCVPLLLFTHPPGGYATVSMVDLEYLGYSTQNLPDAAGNADRLLEAPYWPFDGLNEKGVAIGIMAVPEARSPFVPGRVTIGEIDAVRLVLDYAGSVEEAITLMGRYNVRLDDPPVHYLIADRSGHSAVVEFVSGRMVVLRNEDPWQVSTNFVIAGSLAPDTTPCWRFNTVHGALAASDGIATAEEALELLERSSQSITQWSVVYRLDAGRFQVAVARAYSVVHEFSLTGG